MEEMANPIPQEEGFSFSATVVPFDPPVPLLRGPVPAGPTDDPSAGAFVLAFPSAAGWCSARRSTESKIVHQCLAGARVGCSISASNKCKLPWWKQLFGVVSEADYAERERCEEGEMSACLAASQESCVQFAKDKCLPPFRDARIAFNWESNGAPQLIFSAPDTAAVDALDSNILECASAGGGGLAPTNYRGSVLLEKKSSI